MNHQRSRSPNWPTGPKQVRFLSLLSRGECLKNAWNNIVLVGPAMAAIVLALLVNEKMEASDLVRGLAVVALIGSLISAIIAFVWSSMLTTHDIDMLVEKKPDMVRFWLSFPSLLAVFSFSLLLLALYISLFIGGFSDGLEFSVLFYTFPLLVLVVGACGAVYDFSLGLLSL